MIKGMKTFENTEHRTSALLRLRCAVLFRI